MDEWIDIECPYCGQHFEIAVDTTSAHQQFVTDCDVCCRPFTINAECENGEVVRCDALSN